MRNKKYVFIFLILILISILYFLKTEIYNYYSKKFQKKTNKSFNEKVIVENSFSSNIINDVNYISRDAKGNEYIINASTGEIDLNNPDIIFLTNVTAYINLNNSNQIDIKSDFGKYNTKNFDTVFSKNVKIKYLDNKVTGEYLDFSLERNLMVISRDIVYTNFENILTADVLEMNIQTKDTKIYMYENKKKVNIKSKN
tara:strand:- start:567 stop:1160 length:594 start_codon:yes stop_codon:yes gene_type:complete